MSVYFAISFPAPQALNLDCKPDEVKKTVENTLSCAINTQKKVQRIANEAKKAFTNLATMHQCLTLFFFNIALGSMVFQLFQYIHEPERNPTGLIISALSTAAAAVFSQQVFPLPQATPLSIQQKEGKVKKAEAICQAAFYLDASKEMALTLLNPESAKDIRFCFETFDVHSKSIQAGHLPGDLKESWIEVKQACALPKNQQKIPELVQRKIFPLIEWYALYLQNELALLSEFIPLVEIIIEK